MSARVAECDEERKSQLLERRTRHCTKWTDPDTGDRSTEWLSLLQATGFEDSYFGQLRSSDDRVALCDLAPALRFVVERTRVLFGVAMRRAEVVPTPSN